MSTGKNKTTRVMLVDDHPIVRRGLADTIAGEPDLVVCAEAESRPEALEAIEQQHPDLMIVDIALKNSSGMDLIKDIRVRWPHLPILVVSMFDEDIYAERVIRAGAQGYITKQEATRSIVTAIRRVLSGQVYLDDRIASTVITRLARNPKAGNESSIDVLTDRELQVFELTGDGLSIREIAEKLHVDPTTVETYRARIKEKLALDSSSELLQLAIRWGRQR